MKSRILLLTVLLSFSIAHSFSQTADDLKARVEFGDAEKSFESRQYEKALQGVNATEQLLGKWTPKVSFLKIQTLDQVTLQNHYTDSTLNSALIREIKRYMDFAGKNTDAVVPEKFKYVYGMEKSVKAIPKIRLARNLNNQEDYNNSFLLVQQAVNDGNIFAKYVLGFLYYHGLGVEKNLQLASTLLLEAADNGCIDAMIYLGTGLVENKECKKVMECLLEAANAGDSRGMFGLALSYSYGYCQKNDDKTIVAWYMKAAEKGEENAMRNIARQKEEEGDWQEAINWYIKAADKGSIIAMKRLSEIYKNGKWVEKDEIKASEFDENAKKAYDPDF